MATLESNFHATARNGQPLKRMPVLPILTCQAPFVAAAHQGIYQERVIARGRACLCREFFQVQRFAAAEAQLAAHHLHQ